MSSFNTSLIGIYIGKRKSSEASVHMRCIKEWDKMYVLNQILICQVVQRVYRVTSTCRLDEHESLPRAMILWFVHMLKGWPGGRCSESEEMPKACKSEPTLLERRPWCEMLCPSSQTLPSPWVLANRPAGGVWGITLVLRFEAISNGSWNRRIFLTCFVSFPPGLHFHLLSCRK